MGGYWLSLVVEDQILIPALVHIAIHGVQLNAPTRWHGRDFAPANIFPELQTQFIDCGLLAGALSLTAFALVFGVVGIWKVHWSIRAGFLLAWMFCLGCIAWLIHWCATAAVPTLSPMIAPLILTQPTTNYSLGLVLIVFASGIFAWRISAMPQPVMVNAGPSDTTPPSQPIHRQIAVMLLFLIAALWGSLTLWGFSILDILDSIGDYFSIPFWTMRMAAMILVSQQLWIRWRSKSEFLMPSYAINPWRFFCTASLAMITGIVIVPAIAWYGFALYLWSGMP